MTLIALVMAAEGAAPVAERVPCGEADRQPSQQPDAVQLTGWLGTRIRANVQNRLAKMDPARLLEGYRKRPGRQSWDGEHVGKWLHAATLAWVNTGDPALRAKLDFTVAELCKCQMVDGYLGTYLPQDRWTAWDVRAHNYNLLGLITYMRGTGNLEPLPACRRMADLLCQTFGDEPGKRDLITAREHVGMAPTSVLEPMMLLYRLTAEPRYLDFCKYILRLGASKRTAHHVAVALREARGQGRQRQSLRDALVSERCAGVLPDGRRGPADSRRVPDRVAGHRGQAPVSPRRGSMVSRAARAQATLNNSINDDDLVSPVVTFDGQPAVEDWFAVTLPAPVPIRRVVFRHGNTFHGGGWFDARAGKPRVQAKRDDAANWETIGELSAYPMTTTTDKTWAGDGVAGAHGAAGGCPARHRRSGKRQPSAAGLCLLRRVAGIQRVSQRAFGRRRVDFRAVARSFRLLQAAQMFRGLRIAFGLRFLEELVHT